MQPTTALPEGTAVRALEGAAPEAPSLSCTVRWATGTAVALFVIVTLFGVRFLLDYDNELARTILRDHRGAIVSIYARIALGYLVAGALAGLALHPFVRGRKAVPAVVLLAVLGFVHTVTDGTHFLYGPIQSVYSAVRDALPAWIRSPYRPWMIEFLFAALAALSLWRWSRLLPARPRLVALLVPVVALGAACWPSSAKAPKGPPCFLFLVSDSLRADHLSCNGYPRKTSPNIDALAAEGTNFTNCLVPTASTHESWIALLSSTEPRDNGLRHMYPSRDLARRISEGLDFVPRLLRARGYLTGVLGGWCGNTFSIFDTGFEHVDVSSSQNHRALIAEAAFINHLGAASFLDNPVGCVLVPELQRVSFTRGTDVLTGRARSFLERAAREGRPFFLAVAYNTTHLPYSASYPFDRAFTDPAYKGRNRYRIDFKVDEMIQRGFDHDLTPEETRHVIDLYDGCVAEFDAQVGALVKALDETGFRGRTIVGVWGDHGDDLYEHGTTLGHGVTLFGGDHANRVPAVFAGPGVPRRRVDELVRSFDLAPTWFAWLGLERPGGWRGVDLSGAVPPLWALLETSYLLYRQPVPDLRPGEVVQGFPKTMDHATYFDPKFDFNQVLKEELEDDLLETKCYAVREGTWKLIRVPGVHGPIYRLFDLSEDPQCQRDVAAAEPEVFTRLSARLPQQGN